MSLVMASVLNTTAAAVAVATVCVLLLLHWIFRVQPQLRAAKSGAGCGKGTGCVNDEHEATTFLEVGLAHLEQLVESAERRILSRVLVNDLIRNVRVVLLELRAAAEADSLHEPFVRANQNPNTQNDEFTSSWFTLAGGGQTQKSLSSGPQPSSAALAARAARASGGPLGSPYPRVPDTALELLSWIRGSFHEWDFDMARLRSWCATADVSPLLAIVSAVHSAAVPGSLASLLGSSERTLLAFTQRIVCEYRQLPYHSEMHACDVMHAATIMHRRICGSDAPPHETGALILAAMVHDVGHGGVNNSFLIESHSPLAIRYNDQSVLENHHIALAFSIMRGHDGRSRAGEADPLSRLDKASYKRVRAETVALVLATNFEHHFVHINHLKARAKAAAASAALACAPETDEKALAEERLQLLKMIVKAADIGHPARQWDWHLDSAKRACAEFFHQGECEAAAGLPVSPLNNAAECNLSKAQTGFLEFMVKPAFDVLRTYVEACPHHVAPDALSWLQQPLNHLEHNIATWKDMTPDESAAIKEEVCAIAIVEPYDAHWFDVPLTLGHGALPPMPAALSARSSESRSSNGGSPFLGRPKQRRQSGQADKATLASIPVE